MPVTETKSGKSGSRGEPEKTRAAILNAALVEFAHEGVAGARTDEIARNAGVNKALLYYYFKDKNNLYAAALEHVLAGLTREVEAVLDRTNMQPREKLLLFVETQFDYMGASPLFPRLLQREFMRAGRRPAGSGAGFYLGCRSRTENQKQEQRLSISTGLLASFGFAFVFLVFAVSLEASS